MIPYSDFYYFYIMLLILIPAIIIGLLGKRIKGYGILATAFVIFLVFGSSKLELECLAIFYLVQLILVYIYLLIIKRFKQRWILWVMVLGAITPMVYTKLAGTLHLKQAGFLGISYVSFKAVQILIQIYDGHITEIKMLDFTYFLLFFPTLSSGPIDRSKRFIGEINSKISRKDYLELLGTGIWKTVLGIGYKFVIAYYINEYWLKKIPLKNYTFIQCIKYMYSYSLYLFFDFAGYSLIAIGMSYILAVKTPENFNMPFISKDIKEFWNRWHMTLSFWFRDFIYNRFVYAAIKKKWFNSKYTASYIGYGITMTLMGLWHGLEIHYIVYGIYHGSLIVVTDIFQRDAFYKKNKDKTIYKIVATVITFNLICFGFLIFSGYLFK